MASKDSKYGEGGDQRDVPFYTKGDEEPFPQITEDDPINDRAWEHLGGKTTSQKDV